MTATTSTPAAERALSLRVDRKRWETLRARAALASVTATMLEADDGGLLIVVSRWALTKSFATLDELEAWLNRVGAPG